MISTWFVKTSVLRFVTCYQRKQELLEVNNHHKPDQYVVRKKEEGDESVLALFNLKREVSLPVSGVCLASRGRRRPPAPWRGRRPPASRPRGTWRRCRSSARRRRRTERSRSKRSCMKNPPKALFLLTLPPCLPSFTPTFIITRQRRR